MAAPMNGQMMKGKAVLKRAGQQAPQGPVNYSGTGMGAPAARPQQQGMPARPTGGMAQPAGMMGQGAGGMPGQAQPMPGRVLPGLGSMQQQQGQRMQGQQQSQLKSPQQVVQGAKDMAGGVVDQVKGQLAGGGSGGNITPQGPVDQARAMFTPTANVARDPGAAIKSAGEQAAGAAAGAVGGAPNPFEMLSQMFGPGFNFADLMNFPKLMEMFGLGGGQQGGGGGQYQPPPPRDPNVSGTGGSRETMGMGGGDAAGSRGDAIVGGGLNPASSGALRVKSGVQPGMIQQGGGGGLQRAPGSDMPMTGIRQSSMGSGYQSGQQQQSVSGGGSYTEDPSATRYDGSNTGWGGTSGSANRDANWRDGMRPGDSIGVGKDPLSMTADAMTDTDITRYQQTFDPFNTVNADANNALGAQMNMYDDAKTFGVDAENAAREQLAANVNSERDAGMRDLYDRQARGAVNGTGAATGIYNSAMNQIQEGERGIRQDSFGREMQRLGGRQGAAGALANSLTEGNAYDMENLLAQFTSNKELQSQFMSFLPQFLDALLPDKGL